MVYLGARSGRRARVRPDVNLNHLAVDEALRRAEVAGEAIRVGLIGAGFMGRGIVRQIEHGVPGMRVVAIANRTLSRAQEAWRRAGHPSVRKVEDPSALDAAVEDGVRAVTRDAGVLNRATAVDVVVEATGALQYGAHVLVDAVDCGKDVVSLNVELDATVGAALQARAKAAGVLLSGADGDQPAVQVNLMRFVRSVGLEPLVAGNVKGMQDHYRTPETQAAFAAQWEQTPHMVTSFADGTKISFEQALVANAADMTVARPGMLGFDFDGHVDDLPERYLAEVSLQELRELGGIVDYVVGAKPPAGVFVFARAVDPSSEVYLRYGKLGDGPLYSFSVPQHLTALEVPISVARVRLARDVVVRPRLAQPRVEVVARAKRDLHVGEELDGVGGFDTFGTCERAELAGRNGLLPIGIAEGARVRRKVRRDSALTFDDVETLQDTLVTRLRREQEDRFGVPGGGARTS